jgi:hypothetical protein
MTMFVKAACLQSAAESPRELSLAPAAKPVVATNNDDIRGLAFCLHLYCQPRCEHFGAILHALCFGHLQMSRNVLVVRSAEASAST